ncbi:MAG: LD-carboxypeptidase [Betaproteobacteria bacterium]|nr:LD-carboxypeptidase [Betaproteobacteria bacterium]
MPSSTHPDKQESAADCRLSGPGAQTRADSVYLISPAGAIEDPGACTLALQQLSAQGWSPRADRALCARWQRFAGTDRQRLLAVERAARQSSARMVMMSRGGYGWMRLLSHLPFKALADADKFWVGFSDTTAFHLAMLGTTASITWAGPMLLDDFGREEVDETTSACLREAFEGRLEALGFRFQACAAAPSALDERGVLWGGNLSMVCAMLGSPWLQKAPEAGILFLEDVGEHPYQIERMLLRLLNEGVLDKQKAVLLGSFNGYSLRPHDRGYDLQKVLRWIASQTKVPMLSGLPFGHVRTKLCLPHGMRIGLATALRNRLRLSLCPHECKP